MKDIVRIKERVKRTTMMKSMIITKKCKGAISKMEKLLMMWMKAQIQKHA
jgi:hypothetical protein